jgi:hypothetical protein
MVGLRWASAWTVAGPERVWVEPSSWAQVERKFFYFSKIISSAKTITVKPSKCLQGTKNSHKNFKNSRKIPRDTLGHEQSK